MSSNNSYSYSSSSSYSYSSSGGDGQAKGQAYSQQVHSTPSGTTVKSSSQNLGEPAQHEVRQYDAQGRELVGGPTGTSNRITDAEQAERDREYEERIEEEYAKREGGA